VVLLNSRLLIEDWNRAATELWGLRTEEVLGEPIFGLDFGLPLEALQDPLRASRNPGASPTMLEVRAVDRSGQGITCRVSVVPITDDESDAAAMLIIDVLERASS